MDKTSEFVRRLFEGRPIWMSVVMIFCFYMTFIYMPFDMFAKPVGEDEEVWFGIILTGWAAKATEPLHWAIYAAASWGFYRMKWWMWPWAALYVAQIAIGMFVWTVMSGGRGLLVAALVSVPFVALAVALWQAKPAFQKEDGVPGESTNN